MTDVEDPSATRRRIGVITPVIATDAIDVESTLDPFRDQAIHVENFFIAEGPSSIEDDADVRQCLPGLMQVATDLADQGWDALIVNCMCDPGLQELRRIHATPVFGPAETSMHAIAARRLRFSVLDVVCGGRELVERQVALYGVKAHFVSHRAIDTPVLELFRDPASTLAALEGVALKALADGAETLLLGCTGLAELASGLRARLEARGLPHGVVEPLRTTLAVARARVSGDSVAGGRKHLA